jgi:hypothetical protein
MPPASAPPRSPYTPPPPVFTTAASPVLDQYSWLSEPPAPSSTFTPPADLPPSTFSRRRSAAVPARLDDVLVVSFADMTEMSFAFKEGGVYVHATRRSAAFDFRVPISVVAEEIGILVHFATVCTQTRDAPHANTGPVQARQRW